MLIRCYVICLKKDIGTAGWLLHYLNDDMNTNLIKNNVFACEMVASSAAISVTLTNRLPCLQELFGTIQTVQKC